jgi:hypothetical protein
MVENNFAKIGLAARASVPRWTGSLYASHQIQPQWDCCFTIHFGDGGRRPLGLAIRGQQRPRGTNDALELGQDGRFQVPYAWLGWVHVSHRKKLQGSLKPSLRPQPRYLSASPKTVPLYLVAKDLPRGPQPDLFDLFCAIVKLFLLVWIFEDIFPVDPA